MKKIFTWCYRILLGILLLAGVIGVFVVLPIKPEVNPAAKLGLTFSPRAATALNLDWRETYQSMLTDLKPDVLRIPIYWDVLEPQKDEYNWEEFDFQLDLLSDTKTEAILVVGHKLPRWPECHLPEWISEEKNVEIIEKELFEMVEDVVRRYRSYPNVTIWQVQNEVLFGFGDCPEWSGNRDRLKRLVQLVQELAPEDKVATSDSGELSTWLQTSTLPIDTLHISLYRSVFNADRGGYFYWPVNPYYYKLHMLLVKPFVREIIISELQLEPWGPAPVYELTDEQTYLSISPIHLDQRLDFAQRTGATTVLGWGVEWWYYMDEFRNNSSYLDAAKKHFLR